MQSGISEVIREAIPTFEIAAFNCPKTGKLMEGEHAPVMSVSDGNSYSQSLKSTKTIPNLTLQEAIVAYKAQQALFVTYYNFLRQQQSKLKRPRLPHQFAIAVADLKEKYERESHILQQQIDQVHLELITIYLGIEEKECKSISPLLKMKIKQAALLQLREQIAMEIDGCNDSSQKEFEDTNQEIIRKARANLAESKAGLAPANKASRFDELSQLAKSGKDNEQQASILFEERTQALQAIESILKKLENSAKKYPAFKEIKAASPSVSLPPLAVMGSAPSHASVLAMMKKIDEELACLEEFKCEGQVMQNPVMNEEGRSFEARAEIEKGQFSNKTLKAAITSYMEQRKLIQELQDEVVELSQQATEMKTIDSDLSKAQMQSNDIASLEKELGELRSVKKILMSYSGNSYHAELRKKAFRLMDLEQKIVNTLNEYKSIKEKGELSNRALLNRLQQKQTIRQQELTAEIEELNKKLSHKKSIDLKTSAETQPRNLSPLSLIFEKENKENKKSLDEKISQLEKEKNLVMTKIQAIETKLKECDSLDKQCVALHKNLVEMKSEYSCLHHLDDKQKMQFDFISGEPQIVFREQKKSGDALGILDCFFIKFKLCRSQNKSDADKNLRTTMELLEAFHKKFKELASQVQTMTVRISLESLTAKLRYMLFQVPKENKFDQTSLHMLFKTNNLILMNAYFKVLDVAHLTSEDYVNLFVRNNKKNMSPLRIALLNGNIELVNVYIDKVESCINRKFLQPKTLNGLFAQNSYSALNLVLRFDKNEKSFQDAVAFIKKLIDLINKGRMSKALAQKLIKKSNDERYTPLHLVAQHDNEPVFASLINLIKIAYDAEGFKTAMRMLATRKTHTNGVAPHNSQEKHLFNRYLSTCISKEGCDDTYEEFCMKLSSEKPVAKTSHASRKRRCDAADSSPTSDTEEQLSQAFTQSYFFKDCQTKAEDESPTHKESQVHGAGDKDPAAQPNKRRRL